MKNEVSTYLENILLLILGIILLAFPLVFIVITTDPFTLPKQLLLGIGVLISLILFGAKMISEGKVLIRRTPFDFPLFCFAAILLISSILSVNRFDALAGFVPLLFAILTYFIIVNTVREKSAVLFLISSVVGGAALTALISILSYLKIYILPFSFTHFQNFTPFGFMLDQALFLAIVFPFAAYPVIRSLKNDKKFDSKVIGFGASAVIILAGFLITLIALFNPATGGPLVLPLQTGFQTAMSAISQDTGRVLQGLFFGSGPGTFATDFTRFKPLSFNANQALWSLTFFKSSNFVLELLATAGILGLASYLFLVIKIFKERQTYIFIPLALALAASFLLPLNFTIQALIFILLGIFASYISSQEKEEEKYFDIELHFVAFKKSIIPLSASLPGEERGKTYTKILPVIFFVLLILFTGVLGFYTARYTISDIVFQNSLIAASSNNGLKTYNDQINAINIFPYRDLYQRVYSQTNLALANSLAAQQPRGSSPSAQIQQTITTLIQQSINSGRNATSLSPLTAANWQNLSSVYRGLIGFGQNAENFAVASNQQAVALDPYNPQQYINLGGIYYQLGAWDDAQRQFQVAVNLKPDFANAYYNLGHALESKGDLQGALAQYQVVKSLVGNDKEATKKITGEIEALQTKISQQQNQQAQQNQAEVNAPAQNQPASPQGGPPLELNTPQNQLPQQKNQMKIPAPQTSLTPQPSASQNPAPTTQP